MRKDLPFGMAEGDRYYHIVIAKRTAEVGLLRKLPQVDDLSWKEYFPDKEFLFHALGALGYKLGGETGVIALIPILRSGHCPEPLCSQRFRIEPSVGCDFDLKCTIC